MATVSLLKPRPQVDDLLAAHIAAGQVLLQDARLTSPSQNYRSYRDWTERGEAILESCFKTTGGFMSVGPVDEFRGTNATTMLAFKLGTETVDQSNIDNITQDLRDKVRVLDSLRKRLDLYEPDAPRPEPLAPSEDGDIFIVHGHDLVNREKIRLFLSKVTKRKITVLEDQANRGLDVLGKLLDNAGRAAFAVVILSADDEGRKAGEADMRKRARQNVILELGLFLGMLGRDRVAALYEDGVEIPSDYSGVLWTKLEGENWTNKLGVELKAAGIEVDMNGLLS